jgi:hypothetical protein
MRISLGWRRSGVSDGSVEDESEANGLQLLGKVDAVRDFSVRKLGNSAVGQFVGALTFFLGVSLESP